MLGLISLAITVGAVIAGYSIARTFVMERLRYVNGVHRAGVPFLAGLGAACIALPVVFFLPLVGGFTALLFGTAVGIGVASGARGIRKRLSAF